MGKMKEMLMAIEERLEEYQTLNYDDQTVFDYKLKWIPNEHGH